MHGLILIVAVVSRLESLPLPEQRPGTDSPQQQAAKRKNKTESSSYGSIGKIPVWAQEPLGHNAANTVRRPNNGVTYGASEGSSLRRTWSMTNTSQSGGEDTVAQFRARVKSGPCQNGAGITRSGSILDHKLWYNGAPQVDLASVKLIQRWLGLKSRGAWRHLPESSQGHQRPCVSSIHGLDLE